MISNKKTYLLPILIFIIFLTGCVSSDATPAEPVEQAAASMPTSTSIPPTETPSPSATPQPTATSTMTSTSIPTLTPTPQPTLGMLEDGLSGWCLPQGGSMELVNQPNNPPENAKMGHYIDGNLELDSLPVSACVFVYKFNQPAPAGTRLEVYDNNPSGLPWLSINLLPIEADPHSAAGSTTHTYIIEPPYWDISYVFVLKDSSNIELRRDNVNLHRWKPGKCWNGNYPSLKTGLCPKQLDLHPWDAGYGKPVPTLTPDSED